MRIAGLITKGVAIANRLTEPDLQVPVEHHAWTGMDTTYGGPTYATAVSRLAIVESRIKMLKMPDGRDVLQKAVITFLEPITANGATDRREPIDPRDKIVLQDGTTGPILKVEGLENNLANSPYLLEVTLG